jgi:hypothetical protein
MELFLRARACVYVSVGPNNFINLESSLSRRKNLRCMTKCFTRAEHVGTWSKTRALSSKSMLLTRTVSHVDIILCSYMHYTTKHHLCRHNGSLFDIKWRIKFSCKINFTTVSFISGERIRKGRLWNWDGGEGSSVCLNQWENSERNV